MANRRNEKAWQIAYIFLEDMKVLPILDRSLLRNREQLRWKKMEYVFFF